MWLNSVLVLCTPLLLRRIFYNFLVILRIIDTMEPIYTKLSLMNLDYIISSLSTNFQTTERIFPQLWWRQKIVIISMNFLRPSALKVLPVLATPSLSQLNFYFYLCTRFQCLNTNKLWFIILQCWQFVIWWRTYCFLWLLLILNNVIDLYVSSYGEIVSRTIIVDY